MASASPFRSDMTLQAFLEHIYGTPTILGWWPSLMEDAVGVGCVQIYPDICANMYITQHTSYMIRYIYIYMYINYDYTQSLGPIIGIPLIMILYNDNRNRSESRRCVTGGSQWRSPQWTSFGRRLQRLRTGGQAGTCRDPGVTSADLEQLDLVFFNVFCSFFKLEGIGHEKHMSEIWQTYQVQFLFLTSHARQDLHDVLLPALGCPGSQIIQRKTLFVKICQVGWSVLNGKMGDLGLRWSGTWDGRWFWSTQGNRTGLWSRESSLMFERSLDSPGSIA